MTPDITESCLSMPAPPGLTTAYPPFDRKMDIFKSHLAAGTDPVEACAIALAS